MLAAIEGPDILIILAVVLLLFGSTQIPKLARSLGSASKEFKHGQEHGEVPEPVVATVPVTAPVPATPVTAAAVPEAPTTVAPVTVAPVPTVVVAAPAANGSIPVSSTGAR